MTRPSADASKSDQAEVQARIVEIREEIARFSLELGRAAEAEKDFRAKEDPVKRVSHAREIFDLQQDQLRLKVEIDLLERKIRRLELGYAEDAAPATPDQHPLF